MKKLIKTVIILAPLVFLAVLGVLYLNLNRMIQQGLETMGPRILQAPVTVDNVALSIVDGSGAIEGLVVGNPEGFRTPHAFELGRLDVAVDLKSLRSDEIVVQRILIDAPVITVEGMNARNLRALQENAAAFGGTKDQEEAGEIPEKDGPGKKVIVDQLVISGARVNYSPAILQGRSIPIPLPTIELNDLGRESGGLTIGELLARILSSVDDAVIGVLKGSSELIGTATGQILGGAATAAGMGLDAVGGVAGTGAEMVGQGAEALGQGAEALGQGAEALRSGLGRLVPFGGGDKGAEETPEPEE